MKSKKKENKGKCLGTRGETMIEVVLSLAIFGVTMLMVATLLGTASRTYVKNYKQESQFEEQVNAMNQSIVIPIGQEQEVTFSYKGKSTDGSEEVKQAAVKLNLVKGNAADNKVHLVKFKLAN